MPHWKFWEKRHEQPRPSVAEPDAPRRFSARPRTDLVDPGSAGDPGKTEQLNRLRKRREAVMFDVEQAELASQPENPWLARVALLDEALATIQEDRRRAHEEREPAGRPLVPSPIEEIAVAEGPPPSVSFRIGGERFQYQEEVDWAERGFQLARSELQLRTGDPAKLIPADIAGDERERLLDHLTNSLFVFASDLRDRKLAGEDTPSGLTLADLGQPDETHGGWLLWGGQSPAAQRLQHRLQELMQEERRLLDERKRELDEVARLADRLPIARRRLADVDAEIAEIAARP